MKSSVVAIIFRKNEREVLAIQRRDVPVWVFPGGGIEQGETPEEAVIRETLEETGIQVSIRRKIGTYTPLMKFVPFTHVFECHREKGELTTGNETKDIGFFPLDHLPESFFSVHGDMLSDALKKYPEAINKPLTQVTYWSVVKFLFLHPFLVGRFALSLLGFPINSQ